MATRLCTRFVLCTTTTTTTNPPLLSAFHRSYSYYHTAIPSRSLPTFLHNLTRQWVAASPNLRDLLPRANSVRVFATLQTPSPLIDQNIDLSHWPAKPNTELEGLDFEHWQVQMKRPEVEFLTRDELIDLYIKTLAMVVGSEEIARKKIYSVSTKYFYYFGALVSEELSDKISELPGVLFVAPDSFWIAEKKVYPGEPFINGHAVPYDPKYHAWWLNFLRREREHNYNYVRPKYRKPEGETENVLVSEVQSPVANQNIQIPEPNGMEKYASNMEKYAVDEELAEA